MLSQKCLIAKTANNMSVHQWKAGEISMGHKHSGIPGNEKEWGRLLSADTEDSKIYHEMKKARVRKYLCMSCLWNTKKSSKHQYPACI